MILCFIMIAGIFDFNKAAASNNVWAEKPIINLTKNETIKIHYSFDEKPHPVKIYVQLNGETLTHEYRSNSWGDEFDYNPVKEGKYTFIVEPTDNYYSGETSVTVYKDRVILVPGIMGTELWNTGADQIWLPDKTQLKDDILNMKMDTDGRSLNSKVRAGDPLKDWYEKIKIYLEEKKFNVRYFGYDWRKDVSDNADALVEFIDQEHINSPNSKINIVAHSMGGLISTEYINKGNANKIDKLITLGTPYLGAPQAVNIFETGAAAGDFISDTAISKSIREVMPNIPSAYQLLPSEEYFTLNNTNYLKSQEYLGPSLNLKNTNFKDTTYTNYNSTFTFLKDNRGWSNDLLINKAKKFYENLNIVSNLNKVDSYYIIGDRIPTIGGLTVTNYTFGPQRYVLDIKSIQGDGTVPLISARVGTPTRLDSAKTYYIKEKHGELPNNVNVQQQVFNILSDRPNDLAPNIRKLSSNTKALKIKIECPVDLNIYDSVGRHTGEKSDGTYEESIPYSTYYTDGETKIALMEDANYQVKLKGTGYGEMTYTLVWSDENDVEEKTVRFDNIPITPNSVFTSSTDKNGQITLSVDNNGDGVIDSTVGSSVDLDLASTQDETIPTLTANVTGVKGVNEWYGKDVHYNLSGDDNASGIYKYFYDLNNSEYKEYTEPLALPDTGIYNFKSYVRDKNRNDSEVLTETVKVDTTNPTVPVMTVDPTTWTNKFVTITLAGGTDADSGFQKYQYKINQDGEWKDYTAPFVIDTEGLYNVYARSVDNVFNLSEEVTGVAKVDKTNPPKPIMTIEPSKWTNQSVSITLSGGTDTDKGFPNSGFQKYQYKIDDGEWKDYAAPFIIDTEGLYKVLARSVDNATNLSEEVSGEAKIDRTKPMVPVMTIEPLKWTNLLVTITLTGGNDTDKGYPNSGFQKYQYKIGLDGEWKDYTTPIIIDNEGLYNVYARVVDVAANLSDEVIGDAKVDKTKPSRPTGLNTVLVKSNKAKIAWLPSTDNIEVTGYDLYQDSKLVAKTTDLSFTFENLVSNKNYIFKVVARDEAENSSLASVLVVRTTVELAASWYHTLQIKADNKVWAWGQNSNGQLGDGTTTSKTTAVVIPGLENMVSVAAGNMHSLALKSDGTVWSWGYNNAGQLGNGSNISQLSPVQVKNLTGVIAI
ncbi:hypothetical protein A3849_30350, partial [Paenibacillus sp. P46E]